jgi:hypothetical protein
MSSTTGVFRTKSELIVAVAELMRFSIIKKERRHLAIGMRSPIDWKHTLKAVNGQFAVPIYGQVKVPIPCLISEVG